MAAERSRRHNAGNKMSRLLEAEDEDDFYKTTYGGFTEVFLMYTRPQVDCYPDGLAC